MRILILLAMLCVGGAAIAQPVAKGDCGTIVMPTGAGQAGADDLTSFSPLYSDTAYNQEASGLLYPSLIWINRFSQIDWSRSLASAVNTADNETFMVTMRPWHWSDGQPVTATDVVFYFDLAKRLGSTWPSYGAGGLPNIIKSMTIVSPSALQIVTTHTVNPTWFIYNALSILTPLPEHAWKNRSPAEMYQRQSSPSFYQPVDGPLMIKSLDVGIDAVFVPNPAWEGPKMHFSRLIFKFQPGDGAGVQGVESGNLDEAELPADLYRAANRFAGTHVVVLSQSIYQDVIDLNFNNPKVAFFHDVRVRQAMEDAIDQTSIINGLEHGAGDPAYGPVLATMKPFLTPAMRQGIYPVGYDPAKSRALLKQAGYRPGADGIMEKDGKRLSFNYLEESGTDAITELDEIVQQDFKAVGIEMNIRIMAFNQLIALMAGSPHGWEATGVGQPVSFYPTGENEFLKGSFQNMGGFDDPEANKLIEQTISSPDIDYLYQYETYMSTNLPAIFIPRQRPVIIARNRLHGLVEFIDPAGNYAPDQLYCTAP
jgi:peptide/nickel transport system substrate-binding protein